MQFLAAILSRIAAAAHLKVNSVKSCVAPLWPASDLLATSQRLCSLCGEWGAYRVCFEATFLGIVLGPNSANAARWAKPISTLASRGYLLAALGAGWITLARIFDIAMASLLGYVAQLSAAPPLSSTKL